ncbi:MAG: hypothetical protein M1828_001329 [Chrysothrix sp. TS-e1954]|nr:MAG: hypothetical protein M1828_001329 [Chrysothrix sp. TS-e1954]
MDFLTKRAPLAGPADFAFGDTPPYTLMAQSPATDTLMAFNDHSSHPSFGHLILLVFEAVMEVVCISLPGYIVARIGMFDANAQKFVANLNIMLFTPCLIFSKLASQLTAERLPELVVIPFILLAQTLISWGCAIVFTRVFGLRKKPQVNFVTAMAVFGNSNSLPLSLVISLSHTISGLHWDKIPGDNDNEVAARGILYLLIFSQLGQALRWSWGMNTLLKPVGDYTPEERGELPGDIEDSTPYQDSPPGSSHEESIEDSSTSSKIPVDSGTLDTLGASTGLQNGISHKTPQQRTLKRSRTGTVGLDGNEYEAEQPSFSESRPIRPVRTMTSQTTASVLPSWIDRFQSSMANASLIVRRAVSRRAHAAFETLPSTLQKALTKVGYVLKGFFKKLAACLNVPLVAILVSVVVAIIPALQKFFFTPGTFVNNSITRAISQSGGVAVPLILVVLGANLARNTLPDEGQETREYQREERNMLIVSLVSRMLAPTICMAPVLALAAKYVPVSILDDPIFVIVCFLLTGAPSALQLAQICQVNGVFVGAVSRLLFHSYVIWWVPSQ